MAVKIVRVNLVEVEKQLTRIADLLEGILGATDPIPAHWTDFPEEKDKQRVFYSDDRAEIIEHHLRKRGKFRE